MGKSDVSTSLIYFAMIEPTLNELSFYPFCQSEDEVERRLTDFIDLIIELKKLGVKFVRYEHSFADIMLKEQYSLQDYCFQAKDSKSRNKRDFLYATLRRPYMDEEKEPLLYEYDSCCFVDNVNIEHPTLGLLVAHVTASFSVGFNAGLFHGNDHKLCKLKLSKQGEEKESFVYCLTLKDHIFNFEGFINLMASQPDLKVPTSQRKNMTINLPTHHGKNECCEFGKRLLECDYVNEVLNSIDFKPGDTHFIHKVGDKNLLEIRLPKSKQGYGVCISTSAENVIQNRWIANFLAKKFANI